MTGTLAAAPETPGRAESAPDGRRELRIRGEPAGVGLAGTWLGQQLAALDLSHELRYRLDTVLAEALTNVVTHAYRDPGPHEVVIRLSREDNDGWAVEIEDDGVAFNPLESAPLHQPGSLAEATIGGLGIHLIRSFTDECRYRRENGRNHLTMVSRPRPPAGRPT